MLMQKERKITFQLSLLSFDLNLQTWFSINIIKVQQSILLKARSHMGEVNQGNFYHGIKHDVNWTTPLRTLLQTDKWVCIGSFLSEAALFSIPFIYIFWKKGKCSELPCFSCHVWTILYQQIRDTQMT